MNSFPWGEVANAADRTADETARLFAAVFADDKGQKVLDHLRRITIERALPPDAHDWALRHVEGQRQLVKLIETLIERGKQ